MTPALPFPTSLPFWLMAGAVAGVLARAWLTNGQNPLSRETGQDAFIGIVLAVAWIYPLPGISTIYPPFDWPGNWPPWASGVMFAGLTWLFIEGAKAALLKWAPTVFAKYTGQAPDEGKK